MGVKGLELGIGAGISPLGKGKAPGSMATMAATLPPRPGTAQPKMPPCEWVKRTAGPIFRVSAAKLSATSVPSMGPQSGVIQRRN